MKKKIFEADIGSDGLQVEVSLHPDTTVLTMAITRYGTPEAMFNDGTEIRLLGEAIRLAGLKVLEGK